MTVVLWRRLVLPRPQKYELRIVIHTPLQLFIAIGRSKCSGFCLLHHEQRLRLEPAAVAQGGERLLREPLAIGRIEEHQRKRLHGMRGAEIGRIPPIDFCHATRSEEHTSELQSLAY